MPTPRRLRPCARGLRARSGQERPPARRPSADRVRDRDRAAVRRRRPGRLLDRLRGDRRDRALVRRRRAVPASGGVRDVDVARHRVALRHRSTGSPSGTSCSRSSARRARSGAPTRVRRALETGCSRCRRPTRSGQSSRQAASREDVAPRGARRCGRSSTSPTSTCRGTTASTRPCRRSTSRSSALEIAWTRVVAEGTLGGHVRAALPRGRATRASASTTRKTGRRAEGARGRQVPSLPRIDVEPWQP